MNRADLHQLTAIRRREAKALLDLGHSSGAYYLVGYALECALKACIAKQTVRHEFPNKFLAQKAHVHDLEALLKLAGLEAQLTLDSKAAPSLAVNWAIAKDWSEQSRYDVTISGAEAKDLYYACTARPHGMLTWVRPRW